VEILFNLEHPEELTFVTEVHETSDDDLPDDAADETEKDIQERWNNLTFVVSSRQLEARPNWVRVSDVFSQSDAELLRNAGVTGFDDPNYDKYSKRLKALRAIEDYEYRMDVLERTKSYEEVTEIFVRVNSLGAKLRSSDLALAQITAKWRGSLKLFRSYQDEVDRRGFNLDLSIFLRTLVALITGQSKFQTVNSITLPQLEDGWKRAQKAIDFALNFCGSNLGIDSPTLLSSPFLLVTTAYWADKRDYQITGEESDAFKRWFLIANAKGRYSRGSSETILDQDISDLKRGGSVDDLLQRLVNQMGRLDFTVEELVGRSSRSGAFKTLFLAFKEDGVRDWATNLAISAKHQGKADRIEYHHIFPKAFMKTARPESGRGEIDDIANLAFIGATTNKKIRDRAPSEYRHQFAEADLELQLIDFNNERDDAANFETFMKQRRAAIAGHLNSFLGVVPSS